MSIKVKDHSHMTSDFPISSSDFEIGNKNLISFQDFFPFSKSDNEIGKFSYLDMECPRRTRPRLHNQCPMCNALAHNSKNPTCPHLFYRKVLPLFYKVILHHQHT